MDLSSTLAACLSCDRATRETGERTLDMLLSRSLDDTALKLVDIMRHSDEQLSGVSAVLFRRLVLEGKLYCKVSPETKSQVWTSVLALPSPQRSSIFLKRVGDVLVNLANTEHDIGELLNYMAVWAERPEESARLLAMYMFELCSDFEHIKGVLKQHCGVVIAILSHAMQDSCAVVSLGAIKSLAAFLSGFDQERQVLQYSTSIAQALDIIASALNDPAPPFDAVIKSLSCLAELTEFCPRVWKASLEKLVNLMCEIARKDDFESDLRGAAVEVLATLICRVPGMLNKQPQLIQELLSTGFVLAASLEHMDNLTAWNTNEEETDVVMNDPYSLGKDLLSRAANSLGSDAVLPVLLQLIPLHLQSDDWAKQHTGLMALGMIAEGCHDKFENSLAQVLSMVLPYLKSSNPRLKWAALTTLGLLCSEFEPTLQLNFHGLIMPSLLNCTTGSELLRVSTQAAACLVNYTRGLYDDIDISASLTQYCPALLPALANLLNIGMSQNCYPLLEEVLNSLSMTAAALSVGFSPYYGVFMPGLKGLIGAEVTTALQKQVQADCIKTIGYIVRSVAESGEFVEDACAVFSGLLNLKSSVSVDSPAYLAVFEAMGHFAACLKQSFCVFLPKILPELTQFVSLDVQITFHDADSSEAMVLGPHMNALRFEFRGLGEKQLAINTLELEMKIKAVRTLYNIVSELQQDFGPFVEGTVKALTPLFCYNYSNDIRKYSIATVSECVGCCDQLHGEALVTYLVSVYRDALKHALIHLSTFDIKRLLTGLLSSLEAIQSHNCIGLSNAHELSAILGEVVRKVQDRKTIRVFTLKELEDSELYSEDLDQIWETDAADDKILIKVMEVVGVFLKAFKSQFQQTFREHFEQQYAGIFYKTKPSIQETLSAICIFDDYIEFTGDLFFADGRSPILDQMLRYASHKHPALRQSASYGIGVCAEKVPCEVFAPYVATAYEVLSKAFADPKASNPKYNDANQVIIGAIGKLVVNQCSSMREVWLSLLPICEGSEEARAVHKNFLRNVAVRSPQDPCVVHVLAQLHRNVENCIELVDGDDLVLLRQLGLTC